MSVRCPYGTNVNTPLTVAALGVLVNDTDPQGLPLTAVLVTGPAHGSLTLNAEGVFTYTPNANYSGTDSFTYRDLDQIGATSEVASVTVSVVAMPPSVSLQTSAFTNPSRLSPSANDPAAVAPHPVTESPPLGAPLLLLNVVVGPTPTSNDPVVHSTDVLLLVMSVTSVRARPMNGTGGGTYAVPDPPDADAPPKAVATPPAERKLDPPAPPVETKVAISPPLEPAPAAPVTVQGLVASPLSSGLELTNPVFAELDRLSEEIGEGANAGALTNTLVAGGALASAGYVVLNTRAVYWFLSALLARPAVWRRFDPLDVIYAWETEREGMGDRPLNPEDDESLQSMVE